MVPLPVPVCLFHKRGHCTGFIHVCSTSHGCSAPEIRTTSYQGIIKLRGTWRFLARFYWDFLPKCSYVGRVWDISFFCWSDLTVALDLAVKPRWVCPLATGPRTAPADAPAPGQGEILECQTATRASRVLSYSKWFQWLQDVCSEMERLFKNHLDVENPPA